jgi:hypothetical protein
MEVEQRCSLIGLVADDRCRPAAHSIQHTCSSQGLRAVWAENLKWRLDSCWEDYREEERSRMCARCECWSDAGRGTVPICGAPGVEGI